MTTKIKLKRGQVMELSLALQVCKQIPTPPVFRYAVNRNLTLLAPEVIATQEAFPEPDIEAARRRLEEAKRSESGDAAQAVAEAEANLQTVNAAHAQWLSEFNDHCEKEIEVDLLKTPIVPINDIRLPEGPARDRQNAALVDALMPILLDPE